MNGKWDRPQALRGLVLLLVTGIHIADQVIAETGKFSDVSDGHSDLERECADFLLSGRLHDVEESPPPQCQNYVRMYLEDMDHGLRLNVRRECTSFLMNAELNNIQGWLPPLRCEDFIKSYIEEGQYEADVKVAVSAARAFLATFTPTGQVDAVVLDVDETALTNVHYYSEHRYGVTKFQKSLFDQYVSDSRQPPLLPVLSLYKELRQRGWAVIFITGRDEPARSYTSKNLQNAGYGDYSELVLRRPEEAHYSAVEYKSRRRVELEEQGYRIRTSIGDQWSDLQGLSAGTRTFKLPNPMYYIF